MTETQLNRIVSALALVAFLILFAWASTADYRETVIRSMPNETYHAIYTKLGHGCTDSEIVEEYNNNRSHYDSLNR